VTDPAVLFADEPTGNLDSVNSDIVCELLRDLSTTQGQDDRDGDARAIGGRVSPTTSSS
jgi:hypothetical protein